MAKGKQSMSALSSEWASSFPQSPKVRAEREGWAPGVEEPRLPSACAAGGWEIRPDGQQAWALFFDPLTHTSVEQSFPPSRNILGFRSLPVPSHLLRLTWSWG